MGFRDKLLAKVKSELKQKVFGPDLVRKVDATQYDDSVATMWAELEDEFRGGIQGLNSSLISSWEVALAEIHTTVKGARGQETATKIVERFSDALVPTLTAFQTADLGSRSVWQESCDLAKKSGKLEEAIEQVCQIIPPIGPTFAEGWPKTIDYLAPVFEELDVSAGDQAKLLEIGTRVGPALSEKGEIYQDDLARLVGCPDLMNSFLDAVDAYKNGGGRVIEVELDLVRSILVAAAQAQA